ncbi:peptide/nickel transport system ATP-binding protein [Agromyces flavus]|uniref:Peptide/nickel transport system ATP-binding protein n=1 Tax=Agromyces flavus TaxID=589382 RepID=A0A1H1XLA0_9MICO|nr:ABC transporter ATP-binding protein [Agromyces flavus]MCP2366449.1 peptide/nickel transport system ATP-binding protein [Agromyces flavus]GGI44698.1 peptide ABC transporter ATP-binding protein [Agromyces flavus]SDT10095.1 peptide/nickel transport system ATP-binding protein [Agromyces flavus]
MTLLDIDRLTLDLPHGTRLLDGISLSVAAGETVGLVGESGSGKSLTARSVLGLLPDRAATGGSVRLQGLEVLGAAQRDLLELRRRSAAMVFQDPRAGINPSRTIGDHLTEAMRLGERRPTAEARSRAVELLGAVRMPRAAEHLGQHPHELSGGMLQRIMIAGALMGSPPLLICDEPTTALDVTTQAEIIAVLAEQRATRGMGMLFITHDLNLAASFCDRIVVMQGGRILEQGAANAVLGDPRHPYTRRLVAATPTIELGEPAGAGPAGPGPAAESEPMLVADSLSKTYHPKGRSPVRAVAEASLTIPRGGSLGVVGESGSGKSTLARMIVGLEQPDSGGIRVDGRDRRALARSRSDRLAHARSVQMVFQDPYLSLDPRIPAGRAIEDALRLHRRLSARDARDAVVDLLDRVGLEERHAQARPRTLSGGQRQRVAIARALAVEPDLLVLDEATSALDVSVQAQVLDLVGRVRQERGLTVLFISHDLAVVRRVCDETVVMRQGEIVERGPTARLLRSPAHEYTRLLLASVPRPRPRTSPEQIGAV